MYQDNYFNIDDCVKGYLDSTTGKFSTDGIKDFQVVNKKVSVSAYKPGTGFVSGYIKATKGDIFDFSLHATYKVYDIRIHAYDENRVWLGLTGLDSFSEDTAYIRICVSFNASYTPESIITFSDIYLTKTSASLDEMQGYYREDLYNWMKETLSPNLTQGDLDNIIKLMCYIFGDLTATTYRLKDQINPDKAEEYYLRHLCQVIGYEWNEGLTCEQQRESIKMFIDIRRRRGTLWSLENLIRVFGQDATSFYSSSDLRGVKVREYDPESGTPKIGPDKRGMYPGDLLIEIPQFSNILRWAIDNTRLIGTRIIFSYMIYVGPFNLTMELDFFRKVTRWFDPASWGYSPEIQDFLTEDKIPTTGTDYTETTVSTGTVKPIIKPELIGYSLNTSYHQGASFGDMIPLDTPYTPNELCAYPFNIIKLEDYEKLFINGECKHFGFRLYLKLSDADKKALNSSTETIMCVKAFKFPDYLTIDDKDNKFYDYQDMDMYNDEKKLLAFQGGAGFIFTDKYYNDEGWYWYPHNNTPLSKVSGPMGDITYLVYEIEIKRSVLSSFKSPEALKRVMDACQLVYFCHEGRDDVNIEDIYKETKHKEWKYTPKYKDATGTLMDALDWFTCTKIENCKSNVYFAHYIYQKEPFEKGFIWHEKGDPNYKGFLVDEGTLKDTDSMYR